MDDKKSNRSDYIQIAGVVGMLGTAAWGTHNKEMLGWGHWLFVLGLLCIAISLLVIYLSRSGGNEANATPAKKTTHSKGMYALILFGVGCIFFDVWSTRAAPNPVEKQKPKPDYPKIDFSKLTPFKPQLSGNRIAVNFNNRELLGSLGVETSVVGGVLTSYKSGIGFGLEIANKSDLDPLVVVVRHNGMEYVAMPMKYNTSDGRKDVAAYIYVPDEASEAEPATFEFYLKK